MQIEHKLMIDLARHDQNHIVVVKQGNSNSVKVRLVLHHNGVPLDMSDVSVATMRGANAAGSRYTVAAEIETDDEDNKTNVVNFVVPETAMSSAGMYDWELELLTTLMQVYTTATFHIKVENLIFDEDDYEQSEIDMEAWKQLYVATEEAAEAAEQSAAEAADAAETKVNEMVPTLIDLFYPVGSIYASLDSTSPALRFGRGTWERIENRMLLGAGTYASAGSIGGETVVTLNTAQIPAHSHTFTGTAAQHNHTFTGTAASHSHTFTGTAASHTHSFSDTATTSSNGDHQHWSVNSKGAANVSNASSNKLVPSYSDQDYPGVAKTSSDGAHTHSVTVSGTTGSKSLTPAGTISDKSITPAGTIGNKSITPAGTISSTGEGIAHNNMPPFLAVYMWKRTA